jgi:hypothetical protein
VQNFSETISRGLTRYQQEQRQQKQIHQEQRNMQQVLHAKIIEQRNNKISRISKKKSNNNRFKQKLTSLSFFLSLFAFFLFLQQHKYTIYK